MPVHAVVPGDADRAGGGICGGARSPGDPRQVETFGICWIPAAGDEMNGSPPTGSTGAMSSSPGSRPIGDRWQRRCSGRRSCRTWCAAMSDERPHGEQITALGVIDERSACWRAATPRLLGRGQSSGLSQLVGTEEVAHLEGHRARMGPARRWRDPAPRSRGTSRCAMRSTEHAASAELVAAIAGMVDVRSPPADTRSGRSVLTGFGPDRAEYVIRPDTIKTSMSASSPSSTPAGGVPCGTGVPPDELRRRGVEC